MVLALSKSDVSEERTLTKRHENGYQLQAANLLVLPLLIEASVCQLECPWARHMFDVKHSNI